MSVDMNISDLFFNTNLENCANYDKHGEYAGYDEKCLAAEAEAFLASLSRLGVSTPTVEELIEDLYTRI